VIITGPVRIGQDSVVGSGSVVVKDIPDGVLAVGDPARVVKSIDPKGTD
jgi:acetyltransferase-like isoleucine patch superfamily enzyme